MGRDNVRRENDVDSLRGSYTPHEEQVPLTITLGGDSQILNVEPILTIRPEPEEQEWELRRAKQEWSKEAALGESIYSKGLKLLEEVQVLKFHNSSISGSGDCLVEMDILEKLLDTWTWFTSHHAIMGTHSRPDELFPFFKLLKPKKQLSKDEVVHPILPPDTLKRGVLWLKNGVEKGVERSIIFFFFVKNGIVNSFNNMPDDSFVIDHKLLYNDLVGLICERVGWNRKNVNLSLSILYDTMRNGFRRIAKIKDDASLQVLYFLPSSTYIDLYVDLEVAGTSRSHLEVGTSSGRPNVENVDYMEDDDVGGPFMEDGDHMEYDHGEDDEDYTSISDQSDENQSISEGSRESDEEVEDKFATKDRHIYRSQGTWDHTKVDKDDFQLTMWDGTTATIGIGTCFKNKEEAKNGIAAWNIEQKREFYVKESDGSTWSIWCKSLKESTPKGYVPCRWKVRASLRDHGLWEIVKWVPEHNCMNVTEDNNNRNVSATLIAHLIRHKVELDPDYEVNLVQEEVKDRMHVDVPYHRAWEGRRKAIDLVYGDWVSNFDILPSNLVAQFRSKKIKRLCWEMGTKLSKSKFKELRNELRDFSNDAYLYLEEIDACQWTLAKDKHYRWGNQTTNISESYNNVLKGVRFLPIRALVEATFIKTVDLFQEEYVKSRKCITPVPTDLWEDFKKKEKKAAQHKVNCYGAINGKFKVKSRARLGGKGDNTYTVKYEEKKCSCKKWQEYRFPCTHALAVCRKIKDQPINTVNPYFRVVAWQDQFRGAMTFPRIPLWILTILEDLDVCATYSWGSAVLAKLYFALFQASAPGKKDITGCYMLMQLWVWERIPRLQPKRKVKDESYLVPDAPLGNRWKCPKSKANIAAHCVAGIRDQLSSLRDGDDVDLLLGHREPYEPNRVLRQFQCVQTVPEYPLINDIDRWNAIHHGCLGTGKAYNDWVQKHTEVRPHWNVRDQHVVPHELGNPELGPQCTSDYMPWFQKKTIRFMTDPTQYGPLAQGYHSSSSLERFYVRSNIIF
ncbi:OLC1v1024702C1 [Oldenlandia corymbosa var. corymbosa]|uniref:OLC1v1024702C1 n=1 Tax=Oldenlandia corymbosa var. corymbosa TaxID=529605 RepID=A0AAV1C2Z6_OLDCO|nr:OLC1v1024702C1 [Oldenlandia corymbosa var. corymbosa]